MCFLNHFGKITNIHKINVISPKNAQKLYIEKYGNRDTLDFQLKHVNGTPVVTVDNKIYEFLLSRVKTPNKMSVLDYVIIRGQQVFEDGRGINPIEIKTEDNRIRNLFNKYKNNKVKFKLIGWFIASSVQIDTEKIFLQATGLKFANYALLNDEYKQIIGIANLKQIENWNALKESSKWVDVTFQEQIENKNTLYPSFSFISNNKKDALGFSLKFVDSNNKIIKFADDEKKFPILEFIIEFLV